MNKNHLYFKKIQRYKKRTQPVINFLDQTRLLPLLIPVINWSLRKAKIQRQFQKDLNYRLIGKAFTKKIIPYHQSTDKKTILVPFFTGGDNIFLLLNFMIIHRMQKKGYQSVFLICDKSLPICNNERIFKTRNEDTHLCNNCNKPYSFLSKITGARFLKLSDYVQNNDHLDESENIEQLRSLDACKNYTYQGIELGKIAEKSVLRFFLVGQLSETKESVDVYQRFLKSMIFFHTSWTNMMKQEEINPSLVLLYNGALSFETYIRNYCTTQSIDYVTSETFIGHNSWMYKKNDEIMKMNWDEYWDDFNRNPLSESQHNDAKGFIEGLRGGKDMYAKLNDKTPLDSRLVDKDFVALFTNLNFDTAVLGRNSIFKSMHDWIEHIIDFWIENKIQTLLVIRVHPAELKLVSVSDDYVAPKIISKIQNQENILLFDAKDKVDSYTLIENMKFGLIYSSTIGMEISYMGKACLVAGEAFYKNKGFVTSAGYKNTYFQILNQMLVNPLSYVGSKEKVLKYIYFIYFNRVKRMNGIKMDHLKHINTFTFENAEELESMNSDILDEFEKEIFC